MATAEDPSFRVVCPEAVRTRLVQLVQEAKEGGRGEEILAAAESIYDQLEDNPQEFGEPAFSLTWPGAELRKAVVGPLSVCFGVYPDRRLVVIFWFKMLGK
jgi:hypothetical protein